MSTTLAAPRFQPPWTATAVLQGASAFWFAVLVIGQVIFAGSVGLFYGMTALRGDFHVWNKRLSHGYIQGDHVGNTALMVHIAAAVLVTLSGAMQFLPRIRRITPRLHRWNGRIYIVAAFSISLAGLYLLVVRGTPTTITQQVGTGLGAVIVPVCAGMALWHAMKRNFATHRRWAFRLFLTVSAALFIRAGVVLSVMVASRGGGFDVSVVQGSVLTELTFGQYIVPLAILELYFWTQARGGAPARLAMAGALVVLTLIMGTGIAAASVGLFVPSLRMALDSRPSIADALAATITSSGVDAAIGQYHRLQANRPVVYNFDEDELNVLGYDLLRTRKYPAAIAILGLNTETYPISGNAWDSLAEAYMDNGDTAVAVADYRKSLVLNPANHNATAMLHKLHAS